jgi:hypothetical protein
MTKLKSNRRKVTRRNSRKQRSSRKQRGGAPTYKFDVERINQSEFFTTLIDHHLPDLCTAQAQGLSCSIGNLEPDNTSVSETVVQLGGRGASGSMDMCQFTLNPNTGVITFETIGEPEEPTLGNLWAQTQEDIAFLLESYKVQVGANNGANAK